MSTPRRPRRILIVDDQDVNLRLFEARLVPSGFEVQLAQSAREAWRLLEAGAPEVLPHLILLDIMMPEVSGFEMLAELKADERFRPIPVLVITALTDRADRAKAFDLGAEDFLSKPVNAAELIARARNLTDLGQQPLPPPDAPRADAGHVLLIGSGHDTRSAAEQLRSASYRVDVMDRGEAALASIEQCVPDIVLMEVLLGDANAFDVCRQIKAEPRALHVPVVMLAHGEQSQARASGWEAGADDFLTQPLDTYELLARVRSLIKKKWRYDELYENYDQLLKRSITDPLTGLYNRTYLDEVVRRETAMSRLSGQPFSFLMIDIDHFKRINDTYGHMVGDQVLIEFSELLKQQVRASDLVARYGGEEFAMVLHHTETDDALGVARRICTNTEATDWRHLGVDETITTSIGLASYAPPDMHHTDLIGLADKALYDAKERGRNRVEQR